jgi:hypothetical protein
VASSVTKQEYHGCVVLGWTGTTLRDKILERHEWSWHFLADRNFMDESMMWDSQFFWSQKSSRMAGHDIPLMARDVLRMSCTTGFLVVEQQWRNGQELGFSSIKQAHIIASIKQAHIIDRAGATRARRNAQPVFLDIPSNPIRTTLWFKCATI